MESSGPLPPAPRTGGWGRGSPRRMRAAEPLVRCLGSAPRPRPRRPPHPPRPAPVTRAPTCSRAKAWGSPGCDRKVPAPSCAAPELPGRRHLRKVRAPWGRGGAGGLGGRGWETRKL